MKEWKQNGRVDQKRKQFHVGRVEMDLEILSQGPESEGKRKGEKACEFAQRRKKIEREAERERERYRERLGYKMNRGLFLWYKSRSPKSVKLCRRQTIGGV